MKKVLTQKIYKQGHKVEKVYSEKPKAKVKEPAKASEESSGKSKSTSK